jgi:hypothetical protein
MTDPEHEPARAAAGTIMLAALVAVLAWLGVHTGHLALDATPAAQAPTVSTPRSVPVPTMRTATASPTMRTATASPTMSDVPPGPELAAAFDAEAARLGGEYALAWVDADGLHVLGSPPGDIAWSTIKVPLAIAAAARNPSDDMWRDIGAAVTRSDNAAALALWTALGSPEDAAAAVDRVLAAYGSPEVRTESTEVRPPFSSFGQTVWSVDSQARFASRLACVPSSSAVGRVRAEMARVVPDQRLGIGGLEGAHVKGGWGPEPSGAYVLRQLGDAEVDGERYALALSVRSSGGGYAQATEDASALVQWWAQTAAPEAPGLTCGRP